MGDGPKTEYYSIAGRGELTWQTYFMVMCGHTDPWQTYFMVMCGHTGTDRPLANILYGDVWTYTDGQTPGKHTLWWCADIHGWTNPWQTYFMVMCGHTGTDRPLTNILYGDVWTYRPLANILYGDVWTYRPLANILYGDVWTYKDGQTPGKHTLWWCVDIQGLTDPWQTYFMVMCGHTGTDRPLANILYGDVWTYTDGQTPGKHTLWWCVDIHGWTNPWQTYFMVMCGHTGTDRPLTNILYGDVWTYTDGQTPGKVRKSAWTYLNIHNIPIFKTWSI